MNSDSRDGDRRPEPAAVRHSNAALLGDLPDLDVTATDIVADLHRGRAER